MKSKAAKGGLMTASPERALSAALFMLSLHNRAREVWHRRETLAADISPDFVPSARDATILREVLKYAESPEAIRCFDRRCRDLTSCGYWFALGTLWVSYTGWSDLDTWKRLFSSTRKNRDTSLMKPSELRALQALPETLTVFRAHRSGETDWIAYTLNAATAARMAMQRGVQQVALYEVDKSDVLALFTRRGESEILVLDRTRARFLRYVEIVFSDQAADKRDLGSGDDND